MSEDTSRRRRSSSNTSDPGEQRKGRYPTQIIKGASLGSTDSVAGLSVLGNLLYVIRIPSHQQVEVFDVKTLELVHRLHVDALRDDVCGLATCSVNNCVFVGDWNRPAGNIHRIQLSDAIMTGEFDVDAATLAGAITTWPTKGVPYGLSVSAAGNLIVVACSKSDTIQEYSTDGNLVREITLDTELAGPLHALQLANGQFLISHCSYENVVHRACIVEPEGTVHISYGNGPGCAVGQLNEPRQVAIDTKTGYIFVADKSNDRVVIVHLSRSWWRHELSLAHLRNILGPEECGGMKGPLSLYLDEAHNRLYVGELTGDILVYDGATCK